MPTKIRPQVSSRSKTISKARPSPTTKSKNLGTGQKNQLADKAKSSSAALQTRSVHQSKKQRRKHIDERLSALYRRVMLLEGQLRELDDKRFYRTCIFGSARIKPDSKDYNDVVTLARLLAWRGIDVLTGGGPGLMEAANLGARTGKEEKRTKSLSFGISIQLDFEPVPNQHLDVKRHHHKFSSRLDDFMRLSHSVIVTPGGIGTLLELYFSWQLIQVKHLEYRPIVLLDQKFWSGVITWMKEHPLARGLISPHDFDCIKITDSPEEAFSIISAHHDEFIAREKKAAAEKLASKVKR